MNREEVTNNKTNRDYQRQNNATTAVQGCVYAEINSKCLDILIKDQNREEDKKLSKDKVTMILKIAKQTSNESKSLLIKSQSSIAKEVCNRYTQTQFNQIQSMTKNNETLRDVNNISEFIVKEDMLHLTKQIVLFSDQSGNYLFLNI